MRLINTRTLKFQEFVGKTPPYAILSHTWGKSEVSYQNFLSPAIRAKKSGFSKIKATCEVAKSEGLDYAWVDTCCIDKTSSAELGEAINSMFKWYQNSSICYAYLEDVQSPKSRKHVKNIPGLGFPYSRWFTRGWTLQELIAPPRLDFYNHSWNKIGEKGKISNALQAITGIDAFVLEGGPLQQINVGRRMSWAVDRQTSREEDIAYCLLAIFNVNMPLIYGEGSRAFARLQEEILKQSDDHTLFAWRASPFSKAENPIRGLLASSPSEFRDFLDKSCDSRIFGKKDYGPKDNLVRVWESKIPQNPISMTNKGIQITSHAQDLRSSWAPQDLILLVLNCSSDGDPTRSIGIYLRRQYEDRYARVRVDELANVLPHGRHVSLLTIHGLRTTADIKGHHYDESWTTSYKIRKEQSNEVKSSDGDGSTRKRYEYSFYIQKSSFEVKSPFEYYSICGVFVADSLGLLRFFRFDASDHRADLILKTHPDFKGVLMMRSGDGTELILILLSTKVQGRQYVHWFNAVCLSKKSLQQDPASISELISSIQWTSSSSGERVVQVSNGLLELRIRIARVIIEGIPMQAIKVSRPWPISYLRLPQHVLTSLAGYTIWALLTIVIYIIMIYVSAGEIVRKWEMNIMIQPQKKLEDQNFQP